MYAIVYKENVVQKLMKWNPRMINSVLQEELELDIKVYLPDEEKVPWKINQDTKILEVTETKPEYNPKIEELYENNWTFEVINDKEYAVCNYIVKPLMLDIAKANLKSQLSPVRKEKEIKTIKVTLNDQEVSVVTDRESRALYAAKVLSIGDVTVAWKFPECWMDINKANLETILTQIDSVVQAAFDWEFAKQNEIEAAQSLEEINAIIIRETEEPNIPQS